MAAYKTACKYFGAQDEFWMWKTYMLALAEQRSLRGYYACMVYWAKGGTLEKFTGKNNVSPLFLLTGFFCLVEFLGFAFGVLSCVIFGLVGLNTLGWPPRSIRLRLTRGDLALEAGVDCLAVVEHRLIPARVRSVWARLKGKGLASTWAPSCQDSSHDGHAVVGTVS